MSQRIETIGPHEKSKPVWIYALCDPDTEEPRYVGKTGGYMCDRHKRHIKDAVSGSRLPVHSWIRGVIEANKPLVIKDLEIVRCGDWAARERHWIQKLRSEGVLLFNVTDGGEGLAGHKFTAEHRERIAKAMRTGKTLPCEICGATFWRKKNEIARGNAKFCSRKCYAKSLKGVRRQVPANCTERGVASARAQKLAMTHCKRNHPLSGDNLFRTAKGARGCKECRRIHKAAYNRRGSNG